MSYIGSKRSSSLVSATEITLDGAKLKSSGDSITKSDGTTAVLSESGGVVTLTADEANVGSNALVVDSSGRVGVGTTSPNELLSIVNSSGQVSIFLASGGTNQGYISYFNSSQTLSLGNAAPTGTGVNGGQQLNILSSGNVGIGTISPVAKQHIKGSGTSGQVTASWMLENASSGTAAMDITGAAGSSSWRFLHGIGPSGTNNLSEAMSILLEGASAGNVGIGTSTPSSKLVVVDGGATIASRDASGYTRFTQQSGSAQIGLFRSGDSVGGGYIGGDSSFLLNVYNTGFLKKASIDTSGNMNISGSLTQNSDIRLKENITDYTKGTAELMQIQVRQWQYNGKGETNIGQNGLGVIADEIENVLPSTVSTYPAKLNEDDEIYTDIKRFAAAEITWLLVNTCKEQQALIESQQSQIDALTDKTQEQDLTIASLISRIEALENQTT